MEINTTTSIQDFYPGRPGSIFIQIFKFWNLQKKKKKSQIFTRDLRAGPPQPTAIEPEAPKRRMNRYNLELINILSTIILYVTSLDMCIQQSGRHTTWIQVVALAEHWSTTDAATLGPKWPFESWAILTWKILLHMYIKKFLRTA